MGVYTQVNRALRPFGEAEELGVDLDQMYRTDWPGVVSSANQLWAGAQPLVNAAQPEVPYAPSQAPGLLAAPVSAAAPSSSPPWLLIVGAVAVYFFILKKG